MPLPELASFDVQGEPTGTSSTNAAREARSERWAGGMTGAALAFTNPTQTKETTMTRKDFVLIAESFADTRKKLQEPGACINTAAALDVLDFTVRQTAFALRRTNPRFDTDRFLTACGVEN